ncbi:MAG: hypothetical protein JWO38_5972 [Gemmataceae bacterium]|nr:hypothetical protein [Gemmataceae bacterium]
MSDRYQVSQSRKVLEDFRRLLDLARDRGILAQTARATRWIPEELTLTPMQFGESREYKAPLDLHLRIGFAGPVYVEFAVNLPHRMVFIRRFGLNV